MNSTSTSTIIKLARTYVVVLVLLFWAKDGICQDHQACSDTVTLRGAFDRSLADGEESRKALETLLSCPLESAKIAVSELHPVQVRSIGPNQASSSEAYQDAARVVWRIQLLRNISGGRNLRARSNYRFGPSRDERTRRHFLDLDNTGRFAFSGFWMSRAITYLAPVDAQKEIIAGWKAWLHEIERGEKLRPLGPEAPPEQWLW